MSFDGSDSQGTIRAPKILYHGTTMFRWLSIKRDGMMRCDTRKVEGYTGVAVAGRIFDPNRTSAYLFFTNHMDDAVHAGVKASITDMRFYRIEKPDKAMEELSIKYKNPVVLALRTSNIKDRIDIDPEIIGAHPYTKPENALWYRVKGDIKTKHLFLYRQVDYNTIDKYYLDAVIKVHELEKNAASNIKQNPDLEKEIIPSLKLKISQIIKEAHSLRAQNREKRP